MGKTIVIGAGVVGLLSACELRRRGDNVTIYDKGDLAPFDPARFARRTPTRLDRT